MRKCSARLVAGLCFATIAACGSDNKVTDADLIKAGFTAAPAACSATMYDKYKHDGFTAVNNEIGRLALSAPVADLGDSFQTKIAKATPARQAEFVGHLLSFLESAFGSTTPYTGPTMVASHADLDITIDQYKYFIQQVVVPALTTAGVSSDDISNCFAPAVMNKEFVKTVVTRK